MSSKPHRAAMALCLFVVVWVTFAFLTPCRANAASRSSTTMEKWRRETVYQIYPRSFADGNGDGVGDLKGILSRVDYLQDLGVDMVWLCPVNRTTNYDNGYDVTDYLDIDPTFGTLNDWYALRDELHRRGMKIMMDLVLNHTSDAHPWFLQEMRLKAFSRRMPREAGKNYQGGERSFRDSMHNLLSGKVTDPNDYAEEPFASIRKSMADMEKASEHATELGYPSPKEQFSYVANLVYGNAAQRNAAHNDPLDFYIWRDHPNNWTAIFSGSAWHVVESVGQYYLALFSAHQPDLNWHNARTRQALYKTVRTWVERGVDAFRLDSVGFLAKDQRFPDAPATDTAQVGRGMQYFIHLSAVHAYLRELRVQALRDIPLRTVGEVSYSTGNAVLDYAGFDRKELSEVFLFDHMYIDTRIDKFHSIPFELPALKRVLGHQQDLIHGRAWIANYFENHDQLRVVSRFGDDQSYRVQSAKVLGTLLFTLEGTPYVYQGQEIGMTNGKFTHIEEVDDIEARSYYSIAMAAHLPKDKVLANVFARNRDNVRTVMQWDNSAFAGFSTHLPWTKVNANYLSVNVKASEADPESVLAYYKKLIALRKKSDVLMAGSYTDLLPDDPHLYIFRRNLKNDEILVMLNFSAAPQPLRGDVTAAMGATPALLLCNYEAAPPPDVLRPWEARVLTNHAH